MMIDPQNRQPPSVWSPSPLICLSLAVHAAALASVAAKPRAWRRAAGALALNHLVLSTAGMLPRSQLLGPSLTRLPAAHVRDREVALTFDDGPDPQTTPRVLDLLERHGARASFFCVGRRAERWPAIVEETVRRGHRIENHTYRHAATFAFRVGRALEHEIDRAQQTLSALAGRPPIYFRPPAGIRNPFLDAALQRRNLTLAAWTRRGFDAVERRPERVLRRLGRDLAAGDILLLHDGFGARDSADRPVVLEVLPALLESLSRHRLRAVPLP